MKSLNNKFNDSQMPSKNSENLRNYVEHGIIRHQKSRSKYIYKKSDESEEVSASEGRQNEFVHKHKSEIDAYSVDQSRWNLSVREKLKKRSTKVRQKLMTSRDSIEKLDNEFSGMNKHYQTNQHEEDFKEQKSLEHINTPYYDQLTKKTQMQKVGDFKDKNRESMRSSRIRPRTDLKYDGSSSYSKSLKSDLIRRNVVEELKKRERRFNHLKYIDNNNSSNKEKEEDKVQQNTLKLDTDNREIAQAIEDIKQNSNKLENIMLIENKNLLVNTTHTASLKNDSELGLLGRIISDWKSSKKREISNYRETKRKIKSKKFLSDGGGNSNFDSNKEYENSNIKVPKPSGKFHRFLSHQQLSSECLPSSSEKPAVCMPENELLEKNIATFNPKAIQEKQQYHTELEEMIKSNEESLKEENDKEQHILSEFEGKVGNLGKQKKLLKVIFLIKEFIWT